VTAARTWLWTTVLFTLGAVACAAVLAPPAGAPPARALAWLLFTGSSVHVASTGWLFTVPAVRGFARQHRVRCLWAPIGLLIVGAVVAATISPTWLQWLLMPYFGWQLYHYQKQNIGMASLAASSAGIRALLPAERRPLLLAGWSGMAALLARPALLGIRLRQPSHGPLTHSWLWSAGHAVFPFAAAAFAVAVAAGATALARRPRAQRPAGFCATYLTCLLFFLPAFAFGSPYAAAGGVTIAHGLQYLLLVSLIAGSRYATPADRRSRPVRLALLANVAFIGGAALSSASHLHDAGPGGRLIFGAYLGVVMAHFVIDAGLWRMRDPLARNILVTHLPYLVPTAPKPVAGQLGNAATDRSEADIRCRT
jgi:drug/metabolite transporter superfamily protein YnfA